MKNFLIFTFTIILIINNLIAQDINVTSKFKLNFYGFVKFESIYDNSELAVGDWMLFARPASDSRSEQEIFTMNARHTRVGLKFSGPELNNGKVNALVEVDFAGGFPNSSTAARQANLRLRHAWMELDFPTWGLRFGQDWALISGPFPNTTSFVVGAGKGNLWMRYPQVKLNLKSEQLKFAFSLNRPMAGNNKYEDFAGGDFDPVGDGERSGLPWVMSRLWYKFSDNVNISISGHYGSEQINDLAGVQHDNSTYSLNGDGTFKFGTLTFTFRAFYGENLNSFFGGVFQGFVKDSSSVTNVDSKGGWAQALYVFDNNWSATIGGGVDDPNDDVLGSGSRSKNEWIFANLTYKLTKNVIFMLEESYLKTDYLGLDIGKNYRTQFVSYFKF